MVHKSQGKEPCRSAYKVSLDTVFVEGRGDFKTVCEVADSGSITVGMTYYDYFVAPVYESLGELVNVGFNSTGLRIEKVGHQPTKSVHEPENKVFCTQYLVALGALCTIS